MIQMMIFLFALTSGDSHSDTPEDPDMEVTRESDNFLDGLFVGGNSLPESVARVIA